MRVSIKIIDTFKNEYPSIAENFLRAQGYLAPEDSITARRFLSRSVLPHVQTLSNLFNRIEGTQTDAIDSDPYWKDSSNPKNRRLSYFLGFSAANSFRIASVWGELHRLGFRFPNLQEGEDFKILELGSGLAAGAAGVLMAEACTPLLSSENPATHTSHPISVSLIEQNKASLELGGAWLEHLGQSFKLRLLQPKLFHRKVELDGNWIPKVSPVFNTIISSFFINESGLPAKTLAQTLTQFTRRHLNKNGVLILIEPALKQQSRKLLELREEILALGELKILTPCLGEQACGAFKNPEDWCHDTVTWWRPPFLKELDDLTGLDHKFLSFSYLVLTRELPESLTEKGLHANQGTYRLVSPVRTIGRDEEYYVCGQTGKHKSLSRTAAKTAHSENHIERGDILQNTQIKGQDEKETFQDHKVLRIEKFDVHE